MSVLRPLSLCAVLAGVAAVSPAFAQSTENAEVEVAAATPPTATWEVEPTLSLAFSFSRESLSVAGAASGTSERGSSTLLGGTVGLRVPLLERRIWLHSSLSVAYSSVRLQALIGLEQQGVYEFEITDWFGIGIGVGLRGTLDLDDPDFSFGNLTVPVFVRLWRFDLMWLPGLQFPLASESRAVFEATVTRSMTVTFEPVSFALRLALGAPF